MIDREQITGHIYVNLQEITLYIYITAPCSKILTDKLSLFCDMK